MNQVLQDFIQSATNIQKALFLMVFGILFVFAVQVVFYLTVKLWPKNKGNNKN
jgi:cell division protein FtsL